MRMTRVRWLGFVVLGLFALPLAGVHSADDDSTIHPNELNIMRENGSIEEVYQGSSDLMIIQIQDAHANEIAQQNTAKIINFLRKNYGVRMVGVEGASGPVHTGLFESFPGARTREVVSQLFLGEGKISGAEAAAINAAGVLSLYGVESPGLYLEHYDSLIRSMAARKESVAVLAGIQRQLDAVKQNLYPPELKEWEGAWQGFLAGTTPVRTMFEMADRKARENGIAIENLGQMNLYRELIALEKAADYVALDKEREAAVGGLGKMLPSPEAGDLAALVQNFRTEKLSPLEFYKKLAALVTSQKLDYPGLLRHAGYLEKLARLDRGGLKAELDQVVQNVFEKIADRKGPLVRARDTARQVRLLDKFLRLRLSRQDYDAYQKSRSGMTAGALFSRVAELCKEAQVPFAAAASQAGVLQQGLDKAGVFYQIALRRDGVLSENLVREMRRQGRKTAVFLSGGFHTEGMRQALRSKGISYAVVLPVVGKGASEDRYLALLTDQRTPFLDVYRKKKKSDILSGSIGWRMPAEKKETVTAMAVFSLFRNAVENPSISEQQEDFRLDYVSKLAAVAVELGEGTLVEQWKAQDPSLANVQVLVPFSVSTDELYVPVRFGDAIFVYHFFADARMKDNPRGTEGVLAREFSLGTEGVMGQVLEADAFVRVASVKLAISNLPTYQSWRDEVLAVEGAVNVTTIQNLLKEHLRTPSRASLGSVDENLGAENTARESL